MRGLLFLRIAVALAAGIGAGMLTSGADARSDEAVFQGNGRPGTVVAKVDGRRLYLAFDQAPAVGKAGKRRASKSRIRALSPPAEVTRDSSSTELKNGAFPFDPMAARQ